MFPSLAENVVLGSLKSFFWLDHELIFPSKLTEAIALS